MDFSEWYEAVSQLAADEGIYQGIIPTPEYWQEYYEDGMTPKQAVDYDIEAWQDSF